MRFVESTARLIRNVLLLVLVSCVGLALALNGHYVGQKITADGYRAIGQDVPEPEDPTEEQLTLVSISWKLGAAAAVLHLIVLKIKKRREDGKKVIMPTREEWWGKGV